MKRRLFIIFLQFTFLCKISFSQNTQEGANPFNSTNGIKAQETLLIYTQAELMAMGYNAGNTIDTLCFTFTSRYSTAPYTNFNISYYYTNPFFTFTSWPVNVPPVVTAGGTVYSGIAAVSSTIPSTGGVFIIPLLTPIVWNGSSSNLVIDICWTLNSGMPPDSIVSIQDTTGSRNTARWRSTNNSVPGCGLIQSSSAIKNSTEWRPDIFSCNTITSIINVNQPFAPLAINSIFFESDNLIKVNYTSHQNTKHSISICDISGKVIFSLPEIKSKKGENELFIPLSLKNGAYILSFKGENNFCSKLLMK